MSLTRRTFLKNTTYASAGLVVADAIKPAIALAADADAPLKPYLSGMRMAATPASCSRWLPTQRRFAAYSANAARASFGSAPIGCR